MDRAAESRWLEVLARLGIGARGVIHLVIGALAAKALAGRGDAAAGGREAVFAIGEVGIVPVVVLAIGLIGYGVWRVVQAIADSDHKGRSLKGLVTRLGYAVSGLSYASLAPLALKLAIGLRAEGGDPTQRWVADVMEGTAGRWAVGVVGVIVLYSAGALLAEALRAKFAEDFDVEVTGPRARAIVVALGRVGLAARSYLFAVVGVHMVRAAVSLDPARARGLGAALATLRDRPHGAIVFAIVTFGILAYALFSLLYARYRRIGSL